MYLNRKAAGISTTAIVLLIGMRVSACFAQEPFSPPSPASPTGRPAVASTSPAAGHAAGSGPYKAAMEVDTTLRTHITYHPADLNAIDHQKLPIILWAYGGCANIGNRFQFFLTDIALYGYLAIGPIVPGGEKSLGAPVIASSAPSLAESAGYPPPARQPFRLEAPFPRTPRNSLTPSAGPSLNQKAQVASTSAN